MSIEAMKLAAEFNRYFTSANGVDVPARVSVSRDEWRQLFAALSQQPTTGEPVLTVEKEPDYWSGGHFHKGDRPHIDPTKVWDLPIGTKLYTHPAPGVLDDAARYALLRERFNKQKMSACQRIVEDLGLDGDPLDGLDFIVDKDRFTAAQAQKGQG